MYTFINTSIISLHSIFTKSTFLTLYTFMSFWRWMNNWPCIPKQKSTIHRNFLSTRPPRRPSCQHQVLPPWYRHGWSPRQRKDAPHGGPAAKPVAGKIFRGRCVGGGSFIKGKKIWPAIPGIFSWDFFCWWRICWGGEVEGWPRNN